MFTIDEKIAAVSDAIEMLRWARADPSVPEHRLYQVLKAVDADLRARACGRPAAVEVMLQRRVAAAARSKTALGFASGPMVGLAQDVLAHWPTVKQGLELLENSNGKS